jgi:hypothetical protein
LYQANAQNTGYLGKKTVIDLNFVGNYIILPNMIQKKKPYLPKYKNVDGQLIDDPDHIDFGGEILLSRVISRRLALGLCVGLDSYSVGLMRNSFQTSDELVVGKHERINVNGFYLLPTISFAHKAGALPMGIVHELGIGYRSDKPVEKDYLFNYEPNTPSEPSSIDFNTTKFYNFSHKPVVGIPVFYSVKFRIPLNDYFFFNAGIRYMMTFQTQDLEGTWVTEPGYFHSENDMQRAINSRRRTSLIKGFVGLSFVF